MWPTMRAATASFVLGASLVRSAINLDGSQAVEPAGDGDPAPIHDSETYEPDQYDCPLRCVDYANIHSWTPYLSVDRLRRCEEPMLLQLSMTQPLDDQASTILIRSCTLTSSPASGNVSSTYLEALGNPKKSGTLFDAPLDSAPACIGDLVEAQGDLQVSVSGDRSTEAEVEDISSVLSGIETFFEAPDNCDENFLFAWHNGTAASVYIGAALGKPAVASAIEALAGNLQTTGRSLSTRTVAQLCSGEREHDPDRILGIAIDTTANLAALQKTALGWSQGRCAADGDLKVAEDLPGVRVSEVARGPQESSIEKRATCRPIQVVSGDSCGSLASLCGISANDFYKYNPKANLCSTLKPDEYVCCSEGDPYKPPTPKPGADGTCATHLILAGDTCSSLSKRYNVAIDDLEKWNKGRTWAWTDCAGMLLGYNMCVSDGYTPLPPPQAGTSCGPLVPGTQWRNRSISLADLNPCPLKACCSNWGYCGPFPAHCDIHAPAGGGPGSKEKGWNSTCVSNCGSDIRINSGPPSTFQRVGYYESYNMARECLWLSAKRANTDGTYTHMHWAFAEIDPNGWKVVIKDPHNQWADFKALPNMKRIVAFGGWAYSTEPATYNIIREAILTNGAAFATNIAKFLNDEGLDGVDIDWEYPGATDIFVNGKPIGQSLDGIGYLAFLTSLKQKVGPGKSVSIAAPASYWYLRAFPIATIASKIDYIVYMTYDLHGQWDYDNVNAFDSCPSGRCIRSHVNLTETRSALSIITKAGVPNNKIFVGEASYGRAFHMAQDGCWGPMCDFTGAKTRSDAAPGRCTKTSGYLAFAEINEIIKRSGGDNFDSFYDLASETDVLLYNGDYVSYMTPTSKESRRREWKGLNFAGTIDWAVDLQAFGEDDKGVPLTRPIVGVGCIAGEDLTLNTAELCEFSCALGVCPEPLCECTAYGRLPPLLPENGQINVTNIVAWDESDVVAHQLCRFACKYGYCPDTVCTTPKAGRDDDVVTSDEVGIDTYDIRTQNLKNCQLADDTRLWHIATEQCKRYCQPVLDAAAAEGRTSNYGCVVWQPAGAPDPWHYTSGIPGKVANGECNCDNMLINFFADTILEAIPIIAQVTCYVVMSSFKLVLDIGLQFVPVVGQPLSAGLDMLTTAAEMASYIYPEEQDPEGAFSWWLSPCGGTDLVPDEVKRVFGILSQVADGVSSFRPPRNIPKGSGRKGDDGNPTDRSKPRPGGGARPSTTRPSATSKPCRVPPSKQTQRLGAAKNILRIMECSRDVTVTAEMTITSIFYAANAKPTQVQKQCKAAHTQACHHYSSVLRAHPEWRTLTCVPEGGKPSKIREDGKATKEWSAQHTGKGWLDDSHRAWKQCDRDEYPPAYFLNDQSPAMVHGGTDDPRGQLVRYLPGRQNQDAGRMWKGACFIPPVKDLSDRDFIDKVAAARGKNKNVVVHGTTSSVTVAAITVDYLPEFTITGWDHAANPLPNDGLNDNPCWPSTIAPQDPGFALLTFDPYYNKKKPPYTYTEAYDPPKNGA